MKTVKQKNVELILKYIGQDDFFKLYSRNASVQMIDNFLYYSNNELKKYFGVQFSQLAVNNREFTDVYSHESEFVKVRKAVARRIEKSKSIKEFFEDGALPVFREYVQFTERMNLKYKAKTPDAKEALADYEQFTKINATFIGYNFFIFLADPVFDELLKKYLSTYLKKIKKEEAMQEYLEAISTPLQNPAVVREHMEFLSLIANRQASRKELLTHTEKWGWFPCYNPCDDRFGLEHYKNKLKQYSAKKAKAELEKIKSDQTNHKRLYEKIVKSVEGKNLKKLVPMTNTVCFYREHRNDLRREGLAKIRPLFERIGKILGLNVREVCYLTNDEIKSALKLGKLIIAKKTIQDRIKAYAMYSDGKEKILVDNKEEIEAIVGKIKGKEKHADVIKGQTASAGVASGKVMVVSNIDKLKNFKQGDILVASMTAPDYVPAMKKSAAIITDEGGITCHAAIVSRELKIPCIIGTKMATKILKDGDLVKVDANEGVVKIIKKG